MIHGHVQQYPNIEPVSVLAELLRTCIHPPSLLLRVEHVVQQQFKNSQDDKDPYDEENDVVKTFVKLFLTDGNLLIQALLHRKLQLDTRDLDINVGDLLEIHNYKVKRARRINADGHVVYLGIDGYHIVERSTNQQAARAQLNQPARSITRHSSGSRNDEIEKEDEVDGEGGFFRDDIENNAKSPRRETTGVGKEAEYNSQDLDFDSSPTTVHEFPKSPDRFNENSVAATSGSVSKSRRKQISSQFESNRHKRTLEESSEEDAFQSVSVDTRVASKRRRTLHDLDQNAVTPDSQSWASALDEDISMHRSVSNMQAVSIHKAILSEYDNEDHAIESSSAPKLRSIQNKKASIIRPNTAGGSINSSSAPIPTYDSSTPFHTLGSLVYPSATSRIPRKSYALTTLAIITWISPSLISRPNSPFPPKRHLKIEDPSLYNNSISNAPAQSSSHRAGAGTNLSQPLGSQKRNRGVTLAVYDHASTFKPTVGTLALFRGVVMQRLWNGECILNIYPRRKPDKRDTVAGSLRARQISLQASKQQQQQQQQGDHKRDQSSSTTKQGYSSNHPENVATRVETDGITGGSQPQSDFTDGEWFITDQTRLRTLGYDVDGLLKWWDERRKELGRK